MTESTLSSNLETLYQDRQKDTAILDKARQGSKNMTENEI